MPDAILFDLDGTLVDSIALIVAAMRHAFRGRARAPVTDQEWLATVGLPLHAQLRPYADTDADVATLITEYRAFQVVHHDALLRPYPGAVDVVRTLHERGHPLAVVTSKSEDMAHRALDWGGLARYFSAVVGLESTTYHKPDPAPIRFALHALGAAAATAWFVGDSPFDMQAGRGAGTRTVAALWGPFTRADLEPTRPDAWAKRIEDVPAIVETRAAS